MLFRSHRSLDSGGEDTAPEAKRPPLLSASLTKRRMLHTVWQEGEDQMATITDIQNGALHHAYRGLYGSTYDTDDQDRRYLALAEEHLRLFKERDFSLFSTAGRSELGGNHIQELIIDMSS